MPESLTEVPSVADIPLLEGDKPSNPNKSDKPSVAGNIHEAKFRAYWTDIVKPDKWVLDVLNEGYKLPFKNGELPGAYMEKNNKSALDNMDNIKEAVKIYKTRGVVLRVDKKPTCVSPLTISVRELPLAQLKKRL